MLIFYNIREYYWMYCRSLIILKVTATRGHVFILSLDPCIWSACLPRRTQIIFPSDSSLIVGRLDLIPGRRVLEAGTGSGALTHVMAQAVSPAPGSIRTFDFHKERVQKAAVEFQVCNFCLSI